MDSSFHPYRSRKEAIWEITRLIRENERLLSESYDICHREYLEELISRQKGRLEEIGSGEVPDEPKTGEPPLQKESPAIIIDMELSDLAEGPRPICPVCGNTEPEEAGMSERGTELHKCSCGAVFDEFHIVSQA